MLTSHTFATDLASQGSELPSPAGGERLHARAMVPFKARFDNQWHRVNDIGLGGFAIKHSEPMQVTILPNIAELSLFVNDVTVAITVPIREVQNDAPGIRSFEFLSLTRHQAALLNRVVEDFLARQVTVIDNLIAKSPGAAPAALRVNRGSAIRRPFPWMEVGLGMAAAALSLLAAAPIFSIQSEVAAVAINGALLRAPVTGVLEGPVYAVGSMVSKGDELFRVRTPGSAVQAAAAAAEQERSGRRLIEQQLQSREVTDLADHLVAVSRAKRASIRAKLAAIDSQIESANALLARTQALAGQGLVSQAQTDSQKIALNGYRRSRAEAAAELIATESELRLAGSGSLRTDLPSSGQTRELMRARVDAAAAAVAATDRRLSAVADSTRIVSPCDCIVQAVMASPGDVVAAGALVQALRPRNTAPAVDALIPSDRVHELRAGAFAIISLPDRWIRGRLQSISYLGASSTRLGLPQKADLAQSGNGERVATAIVVPDEKLDAALVGSPVRVYVASNPLQSVIARVAMVFR